jgi:tRNA/tmRNA/rRNA uracil-C5-methylase (TrmA/RlmC/RlmD family)
MNDTSVRIFDIDIADMAYGGRGVGRHDGKVCFLPGVLPGERVRAALVRERKDFLEAAPLAILTASPARVTPACPLACGLFQAANFRPDELYCPGCAYQHAAYEAELAIKQQQLQGFLNRGCDTEDLVVEAPVAAPAPLGYRNKMALHARRSGTETQLGYFAPDNTTIIDVPACPLVAPALNEVLADQRAKPGFLHSLRDGMTVTFRHTVRDGAVWWRGRASERDTWLVEDTPLGPLSVPRNSFFQVNPAVAGRLVNAVTERLAASRPAAVVDLYCGIGLFAIAAARAGVPAVTGVDSDEGAIEAARYNARRNGAPHIAWAAATARNALAGMGTAAPDTTVILDPPRSGADRAMLQTIVRHSPDRILYVSCAADTMSRDVAGLTEAGYRVLRSQLFDMFPRTPHFESLTELTRG